MILIIGGSHQGKLDYVRRKYPGTEIAFCNEKETPDLAKLVINSFHLFILRQIKTGTIPSVWIKENYGLLKDKIIICDDISSGVVPVEADIRLWREETGRTMVYLAQNADEVIRVFCGIGTKIK